MKNLLFVIGLVSIMSSCTSSGTETESAACDTTCATVDSSAMVAGTTVDSTSVDSTLVK